MAKEKLLEVRVRPRISLEDTKEIYWKKGGFGTYDPTTFKDSSGLGDIKIILEKEGNKDLTVIFEPQFKDSLGQPSNSPLFTKSGTHITAKIGPGKDYETPLDVIKFYLNSISKMTLIAENNYANPLRGGGPVMYAGYNPDPPKGNGASVEGATNVRFIKYLNEKQPTEAIKDIPKMFLPAVNFYVIVQDPFVEGTVPPISADFYNIWNEWIEKKGKEKEEFNKNKEEQKKEDQKYPETNTGSTPSNVNQTQPEQLDKEYIFDVTTENLLISQDFGSFSFYQEGIAEVEFNFVEENVELDEEYKETEFAGLNEEEYAIQEQVASLQEDSTKDDIKSQKITEKEIKEIKESVKTKKIGKQDDFYKLAGELARKLGKNARVNYENMQKGYIAGIHGLCPQGTQAALAALTGIIELGRISGNADWFSFKSPATGGGPASFQKKVDGVVYYNDKVKIEQKNGSWKGTYLDPASKSQWQTGDIIVMGYLGGKPYGHIQIWTGFTWQSDFRQGNAIQQRGVDPNTVALWRLNDKGIEAVNRQAGKIA